jgi:hypothetical protein
MTAKQTRGLGWVGRTAFLCASLTLLTACGDMVTKSSMSAPAPVSINTELLANAIAQVEAKQASGTRVWCVPFARDASGVSLRGNAGTWWTAAQGEYYRGKAPEAGAVMVFAPHSSSRMGHVAVVSEVVSERKILIDHANWHRNQISLKMPVIDISTNNDWSKVRVEGTPGVLGNARPVHGFVYPRKIGVVDAES